MTPGTGFNGGNGNDDAGDGGNATDGVDGVNAAGSILNRGKLTLERVGFGQNKAYGEIGQSGGWGGAGGRSEADDGLSDTWTELRSGAYYADQRFMKENLIAGGHGGEGADGGDGGDAAGAIFNEGSLILIDTVFGGRLSSGTLAQGNEATGGQAGSGGGGGAGGSSYGGDGGNSGMGPARPAQRDLGDPEGAVGRALGA
ncbi:hypothetical protein [Ruegeria aquimaris]|uniref:PE-PGRS family protein n=1 Tax=Ruegeria aquimaris TaxID=2984333 RepID=A0ABT3AR94_9RHOB|nr:hypothetical protein [Ruegeria sp. XHP0148]MCV2891210.1 hypothetical protein [Ruegeria sp. XHP0148]